MESGHFAGVGEFRTTFCEKLLKDLRETAQQSTLLSLCLNTNSLGFLRPIPPRYDNHRLGISIAIS